MMGDEAAAKKSYETFLDLWKNADPDIPILREAKAEYAKLAKNWPAPKLEKLKLFVANRSSGDHPNSNTLCTFNHLFPEGNYFSVLATTGPGPINGLKDFADKTGTRAEKLPTPEETQQIKKEQESLPPLAWLTTNYDEALQILLLHDALRQKDSIQLRAALANVVNSEEAIPPPGSENPDKNGA